MKPKKLVRKLIASYAKEGEIEVIEDQDELNRLYALKIREELAEIQSSGHKDVMEFIDLIQVAHSFARQNGFSHEVLKMAFVVKSAEKGVFGRIALNNLNPNNPSNKVYFESVENAPVLPARDGANLIHEFFNHKSDANKYLTAEQQEDMEKDFRDWYIKEKEVHENLDQATQDMHPESGLWPLNSRYIIGNVKGGVQTETIDFQRKGAIKKFLAGSNMSWDECKEFGWRCFKVDIAFNPSK